MVEERAGRSGGHWFDHRAGRVLNYNVLLAQPDGTPGARNVGSILLTPTGDHYSSLQVGSNIAGDLTGDATLQSSLGAIGWADLGISGDVLGNVTIPFVVSRFTVSGDVGGTIAIGETLIPVPNGSVEFGFISGVVPGTVTGKQVCPCHPQ